MVFFYHITSARAQISFNYYFIILWHSVYAVYAVYAIYAVRAVCVIFSVAHVNKNRMFISAYAICINNCTFIDIDIDGNIVCFTG